MMLVDLTFQTTCLKFILINKRNAYQLISNNQNAKKLTMISSLRLVMSGKTGGLDSCGKCKGTTDGVASRNGTSMADATPRDEFCCCQLYRYESYMRRGLEGNIFSACRGEVVKSLATFAMS